MMLPSIPAASLVLARSKRKLLGTGLVLLPFLTLYVFLLLRGSKLLGIFGVVVFGLALLSGAWGLVDRRPQLVANAKGVTDEHGRYLAWSDIETISIEQIRPAILFAADRKGMRVMVFRARPGVEFPNRWWQFLGRLRYGNSILVLERMVPGTLEELSQDIERLSGRGVQVRPGTSRRQRGGPHLP